MELTWYGQSCFRLVERGLSTVVADPHAEAGGLKANVVTQSNAAITDTIADARVLTGPGEYEIGGTFITGLATRGKEANTIFRYDFNGVTVVHVGALTKLPSQAQIEALGQVGILIVPVNEGTLTAVQSAELVTMIEPGFVVPMAYTDETVARFLTEMGSAEVEPTNSLRVSASNIPEETQTVLLAQKG